MGPEDSVSPEVLEVSFHRRFGCYLASLVGGLLIGWSTDTVTFFNSTSELGNAANIAHDPVWQFFCDDGILLQGNDDEKSVQVFGVNIAEKHFHQLAQPRYRLVYTRYTDIQYEKEGTFTVYDNEETTGLAISQTSSKRDPPNGIDEKWSQIACYKKIPKTLVSGNVDDRPLITAEVARISRNDWKNKFVPFIWNAELSYKQEPPHIWGSRNPPHPGLPGVWQQESTKVCEFPSGKQTDSSFWNIASPVIIYEKEYYLLGKMYRFDIENQFDIGNAFDVTKEYFEGKENARLTKHFAFLENLTKHICEIESQSLSSVELNDFLENCRQSINPNSKKITLNQRSDWIDNMLDKVFFWEFNVRPSDSPPDSDTRSFLIASIPNRLALGGNPFAKQFQEYAWKFSDEKMWNFGTQLDQNEFHDCYTIRLVNQVTGEEIKVIMPTVVKNQEQQYLLHGQYSAHKTADPAQDVQISYIPLRNGESLHEAFSDTGDVTIHFNGDLDILQTDQEQNNPQTNEWQNIQREEQQSRQRRQFIVDELKRQRLAREAWRDQEMRDRQQTDVTVQKIRGILNEEKPVGILQQRKPVKKLTTEEQLIPARTNVNVEGAGHISSTTNLNVEGSHHLSSTVTGINVKENRFRTNHETTYWTKIEKSSSYEKLPSPVDFLSTNVVKAALLKSSSVKVVQLVKESGDIRYLLRLPQCVPAEELKQKGLIVMAKNENSKELIENWSVKGHYVLRGGDDGWLVLQTSFDNEFERLKASGWNVTWTKQFGVDGTISDIVTTKYSNGSVASTPNSLLTPADLKDHWMGKSKEIDRKLEEVVQLSNEDFDTFLSQFESEKFIVDLATEKDGVPESFLPALLIKDLWPEGLDEIAVVRSIGCFFREHPFFGKYLVRLPTASPLMYVTESKVLFSGLGEYLRSKYAKEGSIEHVRW